MFTLCTHRSGSCGGPQPFTGGAKGWREEEQLGQLDRGPCYSHAVGGSGDWGGEGDATDLVSLDQLELDLLLGDVDVNHGAEVDIRTLTHRQPPPAPPATPHLVPDTTPPATHHHPLANPQHPHPTPTAPEEVGGVPDQKQSLPSPRREPSPAGRERRTARKRLRNARNAAKEPDVEFVISDHDLELATAKGPGGEKKFDPRKATFKEEDLKPQPMLSKSKKVFVPDTGKDTKYWERRKKNNVAAKRSRDARRVKENQVLLRVAFLEKENDALREKLRLAEEEINALHLAASAPVNEADMDRMRDENARLRHALSKMTEILKCL